LCNLKFNLKFNLKMSSKTDDINLNNLKKKIFISCASLLVAIGIVILFFTDYIFNFKKAVQNKTQAIQYFKWIILGFILNIIFLIILNNMKSYKNNIIGERGQQGFRGRKGKKGFRGVYCTGKYIDFNYDLDKEDKYRFIENNWKT
jgi:hypothetical protein